MPAREKILVAITVSSLVATGVVLGLTFNRRVGQADVNQTPNISSSSQTETQKNSALNLETMALVSGWNLFSLPYNFPTGKIFQQIFTGYSGPIYTLKNGEWTQVASADPVSPATGYLIKLAAASELKIDLTNAGETRSPYSENTERGYDLITNPFAKDFVSLPVITINNQKYSAKEAIEKKYLRLYRWTQLQKFEALTGTEFLKKFESLLVQANSQTTFIFTK